MNPNNTLFICNNNFSCETWSRTWCSFCL